MKSLMLLPGEAEMSEYRWVPDLVCHGVCPRDANLHALEVPGDRIIVFTAATCPHCRAEQAERELDEARPVLEAAIVWSDPITADVPMEQAKARLMEEVVRYEAARAAAKEAE
jgi:glutaredoxin